MSCGPTSNKQRVVLGNIHTPLPLTLQQSGDNQPPVCPLPDIWGATYNINELTP